jgi:hypothetical protein
VGQCKLTKWILASKKSGEYLNVASGKIFILALIYSGNLLLSVQNKIPPLVEFVET